MNQKPIIEITVNENAVIRFELWPEVAPIACESVMKLAEKKVFDGRAIERLEPGFVIQPLFFDGVDPQIDIMVEPEFKTNPENAKIIFERGIVAMAGDAQNSSGSQYFITLAPAERLNGNFTVIGKIIDGWDEIERLEHVAVEELVDPPSGFVYHRPVKTEMITKVRLTKKGRQDEQD
ncbi:MAG: peptidylprolyl isomerase [Lachnospiraceae bacterium]|nr:peptidylprolyl isomerase [Lachnospiraceae bacterium]